MSTRMKLYYLLPAILISFSSYCQRSNADTARVHDLVRFSKEFQWVDPYRSFDYADQALTLSRSLGYKKGIAHANNLKGFGYWSFGDNDLAIQAAMEALTIGQAESDTFIQTESYYILARGYMDLREHAKANEYIEKAEHQAEQGNNWEQLCSIYNLKGVIRFVENRKDALYYFNKAFELGKAHNVRPINFARIISNIGDCQDDPALAFKYFYEALAVAKETHNKIAEASITDIIGHAFLRNDELRTAEMHLQHALELARELGLRRVVRHAYFGLVNIKMKEGRADEALVYLKRYYDVRDSLLNAAKIRQIVELEAKHALQLNEQHMRILENEKQIETLWKNLLIVLMVFLVIVSAAIYQLQRYRYRKNRDMLNLEIDYLTQQQKETIDKYRASLFAPSQETLESQDQKLLKRAIAVVENNISDAQFGVEKMANDMNMSRTNLHRKMKSITGFPPSELIRSIRLRKAAKLILNKVDSVTQIALVVGFEDYSHFSKAFKKHFGISPSGYAQQVSGTQEPEHARVAR